MKMEKKGKNIDFELIARHLSSETNPEEEVQLNQWLESSEENRKLYEEYRMVWEKLDRINPLASLDLDAEWKVLESTATDLVLWVPTLDTRESHAENLHSFVIGLDLTRGGNITRWEEWLDYGGPNHRPRKVLHDIELKRIEDLWLPVSATIDVVRENRSGERILRAREASKIEWDRVNAPLDLDDFRLQFPPGINIDDNVRGISYRSGVSESEGDGQRGDNKRF